MRKRILSIILGFCILSTLLPVPSKAGTVSLQGIGTAENPYIITNMEELLEFADVVNGVEGTPGNPAACAKVTESIGTLQDLEQFSYDKLKKWKPMGSKASPYTGTFVCEKGVTIYNLDAATITWSGDKYQKTENELSQVGFFGYVEGATIQNVTLMDIQVSGDSDIGGVAGVAINSTIENCTVSNRMQNSVKGVQIVGSESVGGIVGRSEDSRIYNCTNQGRVVLLSSVEDARHKLGGIAGVATLSDKVAQEEKATLIQKCTNKGEIKCVSKENYECTGGIVGRLVSDNANYRAVIKECTNEALGTVSSIEAGTGGIVGYAQNASLESCTNRAKITGTIGVGGVAGYAYYGTQIKNCENYGEVAGEEYTADEETEKVKPYNIGGIVGSVYNPRDTSHEEGDCDSKPVYSYNKESLILECNNYGNVTCNAEYEEEKPMILPSAEMPYAIRISGSFVGGVAGFAADSAYFDEEGNSVRFKDCQNSGKITGTSYAGGVLGVGKNVSVEECENCGEVKDAGTKDTVQDMTGGYSFTVRFDAGDEEVTPNLLLAENGKLSSLPDVNSEEALFQGWFTQPIGGSKVTTESNINKAIILYAQWKEKTLPTVAPTVEPTTTPTMTPKPTATATPTPIPTSTGKEKYVTKEEMRKISQSLDKKSALKWKEKEIKITWGNITKADGYDIFAAPCGKKITKKSLVKTVKGKKTAAMLRKIAGKKISGSKNYKIVVKAYQNQAGKKTYIGNTLCYHLAGKKNKKYTNVRKIKVEQKTITLSKGKKRKIQATVEKQKKGKKLLPKQHGARLRYYSTDTTVAAVTSKGVIKAKKKGVCHVYVTALNGVKTAIRISVCDE